MPYYKFDKNDVLVNTLKLYPDANFVVYHGSSYYNSTPHISGAFTGSVRLTTPGDVSLYELNVDRHYQSTVPIGVISYLEAGSYTPPLVLFGATSSAARTGNHLSLGCKRWQPDELPHQHIYKVCSRTPRHRC